MPLDAGAFGPVRREGGKSPEVHYLSRWPCPHREAGVSSSGPEWKQFSKQLSVSLHPRMLGDKAEGTL